MWQPKEAQRWRRQSEVKRDQVAYDQCVQGVKIAAVIAAKAELDVASISVGVVSSPVAKRRA